MKRKTPSAAPSSNTKAPRAPSIIARVKELKGSDGLDALKWAKERTSEGKRLHAAVINMKRFFCFIPRLTERQLSLPCDLDLSGFFRSRRCFFLLTRKEEHTNHDS